MKCPNCQQILLYLSKLFPKSNWNESLNVIIPECSDWTLLGASGSGIDELLIFIGLGSSTAQSSLSLVGVF